MSLFEQMMADLDEVFFNDTEHARTISWNGEDILAIPDEGGRTSHGAENDTEHGVLIESRTWHIRGSDLDPVPVPWEMVNIDNEDWYVREVQPQDGAYQITVFRQAS